jgi:hypothetical protein
MIAHSIMTTALNKGLAQGRAEGRVEGFAEGESSSSAPSKVNEYEGAKVIFAPQLWKISKFLAIFFLVSKKILTFAQTTKKVVTKKVVIWRIPLNTVQSWMQITSQTE